jgi:hypothetical protein
MTKYIQTNPAGYVTGVINEPILVGLFGGRESIEVSDEQAGAIETLLRAQHSAGEGLHVRSLNKLKKLESIN